MSEYTIILSTTEPNNLVGLLKFRQGDKNSQVLNVTVTENGKLFKFDGLAVFFNSVLPNGTVVRDKVQTIDYTNSKLTYKVIDSFLQEVASVSAWFSFESGDKTVDSTKNFKYIVEAGWQSCITQGNYIYELSEIQREIEEIISNKDFTSLISKISSIKAELIASRTRIDDLENETTAQLADTAKQMKKQSFLFDPKTWFIGHRGCSMYAPENSRKAFELAYYHGMAGIETDLTNTSDGVIFCYHDKTLDTKTDGTGNPRELAWDYVSTVKLTKAAGYDAYPNTKIATLDDYLSVAKKYNLIIFPEVALSTEDLIHEALDTIYLYGLQSQCVILVNKWNYQIVKSYAPNLIRCLIPSWGVANTADIDFCATNGIEICGAAFSAGLTAVPQPFIDYANEKGIYLYGYIINATKDLSRIKDLGIKFIGTDFFGGDN